MNSNLKIKQNKKYTKEVLKQKFLDMLGEAYEGDPTDQSEILENPELLLMSKADVLMIKLYQSAVRRKEPDFAARKLILEYTIGKPKQEIETKTLQMTYQDFLHQVSQQEPKIIEVQVTEPEPTQNLTQINKEDL